MRNRDIAQVFDEIARYLDMEGVPFKPRAYEKAARTIEAMTESLAAIYERGGLKALQQIPGVGRSLGEKIEELLTTGRLKYYEELKKKTPLDLAALTSIEGLGPKTAKALYEALSITNLEELEAAARAGKIRHLPHFGVKTEQKILKGLEFLKKHAPRFLLGSVLPLVEDIAERLHQLKQAQRVEIAGSVRRRKETVGDADLLVISKQPVPIMDFFVSMPEVVHVDSHGETRSSVKLKNGLDVDLRVVPEKSFGAALNYFTGSKDHNVHLRRIAQEMHLKLNEYGLFRRGRFVAGRTEEELYEALGLAYVPPELREDRGEIEAAREGDLPALIDYGDLRGDLQVQTRWTDGANSIEEMVEAAKEAGLEYIAITDHTKDLAMTGGSDEKKLLQQMEAIDRLNRRLRGFRVLKGAEVNIRKDGTLDIDDAVLAKLDVVGIAVHTHLKLPRQEMTARIVRAMRNPQADILFHPTGRLIQKREPYDVDIEEIIKVAKETGTILEVDAAPDRLDLKDEHIRLALKAGVKVVVDSDAHNRHYFGVLEYGVAQARRGWARREDVINTLPCDEFLLCLKDAKTRGQGRGRARHRS
ncbi:MAG: DNA polymerase/3'-5' exonuclease PolX [Acidobacteria bacterium]|nr:DNA polymerase/3'-5' exonuclease PolX [Acidobacteriota bacterium]